MRTFEDLRAWKQSIDLVERIYLVSEHFPSRERFGLTSQMRKAAVSIPSNMAEGQGRFTNGEWLQFLGQARGSLYELQTQLTIAERLHFIGPDDSAVLKRHIAEIGSSLAGLINFVRTQSRRRRD